MRIDLIVSACLLLMILVPLPARAQVPPRSWNFEQLLSPPTATELQRVDQDWRQKSWAVEDVTPVGVTTVPMGSRPLRSAILHPHTEWLPTLRGGCHSARCCPKVV